jgi:hypothetical protein
VLAATLIDRLWPTFLLLGWERGQIDPGMGLTALVAFLSVIYLASAFVPPLPGERAVAYGALAAWLFVPWAYWIDGHRESAVPGSPR